MSILRKKKAHIPFTENKRDTAEHNTQILNRKIMERMRALRFAVFFGCVLLIVPVPSASQPQAALQLLRFRDSLPEASKALLQWNQSSAHCSWPGVNCYPGTGLRVKELILTGLGLSGILEDSFPYLCQVPDMITLDLSANGFTGKVPTVLGNCSELIEVFLYKNGLSGPIPPDIFRPGKLQRLDLGGCQLSGTIPPEVGLCKSLLSLRLDDNLLSGKIPSELFSLPNLSVLFLSLNNMNGTLPEFPPKCLLTQLLLPGNLFEGPLPPTISNCHGLEFLDASRNNLGGVMQQDIFKGMLQLGGVYLLQNNFEGQIPESLWGLRNLTQLVLRENRFNGSIPEEIKGCDKLTYLDLSFNMLSGEIPSTISYLRNLQFLYLHNNTLGGSLPPGIGNCSSLVNVTLRHNQISGIIPPEICGLRSLELLMMSYNQIKGPIPDCIDSLISLKVFTILSNKMTGRIPPGISKLTNLTDLILAENNLTGEVPLDLGKNSPGLGILDLTGNQLTGKVPTAACSGNRLIRFTISNNKFSGGFPAEIIKCKSLVRLSLHNNRLQGSIPNDVGNSTSISDFNIEGNLFEGTIPTVFGHWSNLSSLYLSNNQFSGSIPREFGELQNLVQLRISSNRLTGDIPPELSRCPRLDKLDLSKNELTGGVPSEILSSLTLSVIRLQDNKLTGAIPDSFNSSQRLQELQLGSNLLEGPFPCNLSRIQNFNRLNLSTNKFSGEVPGCIGKLIDLEILDISFNEFSGEIPSEANNMRSLSLLNISNNQLSGHIPEVWVKALGSNSGTFLRNSGLCLASTKTGSCGSHKKAHPGGLVLAGIITGSFLLTACLLTAIYMLVTRLWHHTPSSPHQALLYSQSSNEELPEDLSFADILRGTEGWSDKHVIGRGKHGTVYRAQSDKSQKQWAIKKVDLTESKFNSEMRILNLVRHRNILRMGGYSIRNGYGYIVTEYMPEGTLYHLLHQRRPRVPLEWEQRCRIALGIAQGLSYLHHDCVPPIIHRDIKSDNVLLDCDFEPKIGDFGAAKLDSDEENQAVSTIIGTLGYIAPENAYSTKLTDKCDVYSFGVILLELLSRKLPVDPSFDEGLDIVCWVRMKANGYDDHLDFLDEEIKYWESEDQEEALVMVDLALHCTEMDPDIRPSMRDVGSYLLKFQERFKLNVRSHSTPRTINSISM